MDLFEKGLTAWRIAVLFRVDFEYVEKALFVKRDDYGHKKKNPFAICTDHKHVVNSKVLMGSDIGIADAVDAFAGEGHLTAQLSKINPDCEIIAIESNPVTFERAQQRAWLSNVTWMNRDNIEVFKSLLRGKRRFDLIDLDPFVTCHQQLEIIWPLLKPRALLFVTFGGEYRRSFITSNRKAIGRRYGFPGTGLDNKKYLEIVPRFFIGWVGKQAATHGFTFKVLRAVRYPNTCRFWLRVIKKGELAAYKWFDGITSAEDGGYLWRDIDIPRFRTVRGELHEETQGSLFS
jgi:tRNA G26 N,N-dimethylase Trm1